MTCGGNNFNYFPLTSLFLSPDGFLRRILRRRGCLWMPLVEGFLKQVTFLQGCQQGQTSLGQGRGQRSEAKAENKARIVCKNITFKKLLITCSLSICVICLCSFTHSHSIIMFYIQFSPLNLLNNKQMFVQMFVYEKCHSICKRYTELHFRNINDSRVCV